MFCNLFLAFMCQLGSVQAGLVPDGILFEKMGFILSDSEALQITFKELGQIVSTEDLAVDYVVVDAQKNIVSAGTVNASDSDFTASEGAKSLKIYRLMEPQAVQALSEGWYGVRVRPKGQSWQEMKVWKRGPAEKRVVYLLDSLNPEGYGEWLNQDLFSIEPMRDFPESGTPDLVILSSYDVVPAGQLVRLEEYIEQGGTVVTFGSTGALGDIAEPLSLNASGAYGETRQSITVHDNSFEMLEGAETYALSTTVGSNCTLIASLDNGDPLLVSQTVGLGTVFACAAPLKPGRVYNGLISTLLELPLIESAPIAVEPDEDGFYAGISAGNIGRFGYLNNDRINAIGIRDDGGFRMWDVVEDKIRVIFEDVRSADEFQVYCKTANQLSKTLVLSGGDYGTTEVTYGLGTPGVLYSNADSARAVFNLDGGGIKFVAWSEAGQGVVSYPAMWQALTPNSDRNWLLIWQGDARDLNWPVLLCVNRQILSVKKISESNIRIEFAEPGLEISMMPLSGIRHYPAEDVASWAQGLPPEVYEQADAWSRRLAMRTVDCHETYKLSPDGTNVTIRNEFVYKHIPDYWNTQPQAVAPVPPLIGTCLDNDILVASDSSITDLDYATFQGPLKAALNTNTVSYSIAMPPDSYPLSVSTPELNLEDSHVGRLFERIKEHVRVAGTNYLPIVYHKVSSDSGDFFPTRDLDAATATEGLSDLVSKPFIDLHRSLGCAFPMIMFKPYLDSVDGDEDVKQIVDATIGRNVVRDIGFYQYKTFLRYRSEPNSGSSYLINFLYPVRWQEGYRIYHDMNETAGVILYALYRYHHLYGDTDFIQENKPYIDLVERYLHVFNDWSWMSSTSTEWGNGNGIDMLNASFPGWVASRHLNAACGDEEGSRFATYMAAKTSISVSARLLLSGFYNSIHLPDYLELKAETIEMEGMEEGEQINGRYLPYDVAEFYGEGWPSIMPNVLTEFYVSKKHTGIEFYNTSKGVAPELLELYKSQDRFSSSLTSYENIFRETAYEYDLRYLYSRISSYAVLSDEPAQVKAALDRELDFAGSAADLITPGGVGSWEIAGMTILLDYLNNSISGAQP